MDLAEQAKPAARTVNALDAATTVVLGACALIGLLGAFYGLGVSSFWVDELFTAWVVGADGDASAMVERALTDVHPPLYYYMAFVFSLGFGDSDVALRTFSALAAVGAIVVFYFGGAGVFSRNARLFAAALATGSEYWFFHAQNARSNALSLLFASLILALCLSILQKGSTRRRTLVIGALAATVFVGAFTHYYLAYVGLAALLVMAVLTPRLRLAFLALAAALVASLFAYLEGVVQPNAQWLIDTSWIQNNFSWYADELTIARRHTFDVFALGALGACVVLVLAQLIPEKAQVLRRFLTFDSALLLVIATPIVVFCGAVVSSTLLSPNFTARNFLLVSPFLWGAVAALYDAAFRRSRGWVTPLANGLAVLAVIATCSVVQARAYPRMPPYREAGVWLSSHTACAGQPIPIWRDARPDGIQTSKPGFVERIIPGTRARYIPGAQPILVHLDRAAPEDVRSILRERLTGGDPCPILGWSADVTASARSSEIVARIAQESGVDIAAGAIDIRFFPELGFRRYHASETLDRGLWVAFVTTPASARDAQ
jgi:hypothetical protein